MSTGADPGFVIGGGGAQGSTEVECRRREDQGAEGTEGIEAPKVPRGVGCGEGEGAVPLPRKFL